MSKVFEIEVNEPLDSKMQYEMLRAEQRILENPSVLGGVNVTRLMKDWNEICIALKANLNYPVKQQKVYPFLLEDIEKLPIEEFEHCEYISLPCGIKLNVILFKGSFDAGLSNIKEQIKNQRLAEKPEQVRIDEAIVELGFSEKLTQLMKYQFKFAFNRAKKLDVSIREKDVVFKVSSKFVEMYIKGLLVSKINKNFDDDELLCL